MVLALLALFATSAAAGPYSQLVVFGDSLSDVGNIDDASPSFFRFPGRYYYDGRFSNGPVFTEALAIGLGLPPTVHSRAGGNNFAYGGAQTTGTGGLAGFYILDLDEQVEAFLRTRTADPNALFLVYAGANDLIGGQADVTVPIDTMAAELERLIAAGARQFLVPNLPFLGYTPRFNGSPTTRDTYNARSQQFNDELASMLNGLKTANPELSLLEFDVAGLFDEALADPLSFGLTNTTDAAAPGLQPGASSYDTNQIVANPNEYMFWDDLHPTTTVHAFLAERLLANLSGDFNRDDTVDAADYIVWRQSGLGGAYYESWQANFGRPVGGSAASIAVPEPAAPWILAAGLVLRFRRRR